MTRIQGFDETETARREYIRLLKEARPFCATAERVYLMEDDEWCILYRLSCSPQTASLYTAVKTNPTIETVRCHDKRKSAVCLLFFSQIRFYSAELLIALEALHNAGLFYGPLDARDVLLDRSGHLVLHQIPFYHTALPSAGEFQPEYLRMHYQTFKHCILVTNSIRSPGITGGTGLLQLT